MNVGSCVLSCLSFWLLQVVGIWGRRKAIPRFDGTLSMILMPHVQYINNIIQHERTRICDIPFTHQTHRQYPIMLRKLESSPGGFRFHYSRQKIVAARFMSKTIFYCSWRYRPTTYPTTHHHVRRGNRHWVRTGSNG